MMTQKCVREMLKQVETLGWEVQKWQRRDWATWTGQKDPHLDC